MTADHWLEVATQKLTRAGVGTARLDAFVLLEDITSKERGWLLAHPEFELEQTQVKKLTNLLSRRAGHEPLAYIRGSTEFYGRTFVLTPDVLEPRPESETMIELLKALCRTSHPRLDLGPSQQESASGAHNLLGPSLRWDDGARLADVGAGSGALGITAKLELPNLQVDLLEIDPKALKVAKTNVDKFTLNINAIKSDLLAGTSHHYEILLCNLPYVPDDHTINQTAMHEPKLAIFGGPDGLDLYRRLFQQIKELPKKPLYILSESLPPQHAALKAIAQQANYRLLKTDDFIQVFTTA